VCGLECPDEMVAIGTAFCMDRYEAARIDATFDSAGSDESDIKTEAGVMPWMVVPMDAAALARFQAACEGRGKRLCTPNEFYLACTGPGPTPSSYVFGDVFDPEICNCVDTWCDDYCAENGIPPAECNMSSNCGYHCGTVTESEPCFKPMPTGQFPGCTNGYGTFDLCGNLWEIVPSETDPRGFEIRGGAFNCAGPEVRLQCTFNASWTALYAGFRCCLTPP
jgi:formylglycine-generating enzyme required for sulfatase activity